MFSRVAGFVCVFSAVIHGAWGQAAFRSSKVISRAGAVVEAPSPFRAAGLLGAAAGVRVRASADGVEWTAWRAGEADGGGAALVFFGEIYRYVETDSPTEVEILLIDPGVTPAGGVHKARPLDAAASPPIVSRADWGCTADACPLQSPPSYTTVTHLIVHHTAGANDATDWAAVVRSIWVLHVKGNGWNDIGYNYLIDPNGVIYEGRAGGDGVLGAHFSCVNSGTMGVAMLGTYSAAPLPGEGLDSLRALLAWQASKWKLDATGKQRHAASGLVLDTISGHRDANLSPAACGPTECPGNGGYTELPEVRRQVGALLAGACPISVLERNFCAPSGGGSIPAAVTAPAGCAWQAASTVNWVDARVTSEGVSLEVQANAGGRRGGTVTVGGHAVTITQSASGEGALACVDFNGIVSAGRDTGRPVAPGALVSIYGRDLATQESAAAPGTAYPTKLGGVTVAVDGKAAPLLYVSPRQINLQIPAATGIGSGRVTVTPNGLAGPDAPFSVTEAAPALFVSPDGRAIATNDADGQVNGPDAPAAPGGGVTVYLTGANASAAPTATVGGRTARVISTGAMAGGAGVFQVDLAIPEDAEEGDQPVVITMSGAASSPAPVAVGRR